MVASTAVTYFSGPKFLKAEMLNGVTIKIRDRLSPMQFHNAF
jgi:hypothetical protein